MNFWPSGFDSRAEIIGYIRLASIEAPSGLARFMIGQDGIFTDEGGNTGTGSQLLDVSDLTLPRDASAPEGQVVMSYFQDPDAPDLVDEIRESGDDAIAGSVERFYLQPLGDVAEFYKPVYPPILRATRVAAGLRVKAEGDTVRQIILPLEGPFRRRIASRGLFYTVPDHAKLICEANPSLQFMPQIDQQIEKLYG